MNDQAQLIQKIKALKTEKKVSLFAHYYAEGVIQDIADHVGDSFYLAKTGQLVPENNILLSGVVFMAESIKILNPQKTILVPDMQAGCSLVDGAPFEKYLAWRKQHPTAICVTYINSSTQVKSISDVIITSSNAAEIIASLPKDRPILFGPDQHLGRWMSKQLNREMIFWPGSCQVHVLFNAERLKELIAQNPDALVIAHPECDDEILKFAQVIGSTSKLLNEVVNNKKYKKFIVATETGILHQMQKDRPEVELLQAPVIDKDCKCNDCPFMKMNSLEKIYHALDSFKPEIFIKDSLREKAFTSLDRMMKITSHQPVQWPDSFSE